MSKLKNLKELVRIVSRLKRKGRKIVFTNGCFDILHAGHLKSLLHAKKMGDVLIVGINSDNSVRRLKGYGRPIFSAKDRSALVCGLEMVDYCIIFNEDTPERIIRELVPDILVKGADYRGKKVVGADIVRAAGGRVAFVPYLGGRSTSAIIKKIKSAS